MKTTYEYNQLDPNIFEKYYHGVEHKTAVDLFIKISKIFLKNIDSKIRLLSSFLASQKNTDAIVAAHQIKGSLLSLGGTQLAEIFRHIELGIGTTPNAELEQMLGDHSIQLQVFIQELNFRIQQLQESLLQNC